MHQALIHSSQGEGFAADDVDRLRGMEYRLLGALLTKAPDPATLEAVAGIRGDGSVLGQAHDELARAAICADPAAVEREFFKLFVGVARGELLPYASYYLAGFLNERPLADVRADLAALGLERAQGRHDPEDHIALLADVMATLAEGRIVSVYDAGRGFFERHLAPWSQRFFADLAGAPSARFYRAVGAVGVVFTRIEEQAFAMEP